VGASTTSVTARPLAAGLFTWPSDDPHLLGSRCADCGTMTFPTHVGCPRCASQRMSTVELGTRGTVWTWTSQEFRPPPPYAGPSEFRPYYLGFVELPGELMVESYFTGYDDRTPTIGDEVELTIVPFNTDDEGDEIVTYAFRPVDGERVDRERGTSS
jgi:uncharacterized OB-fold protein